MSLTYPPAFALADEAAMAAQRRFLAATLAQLILVVTAGIVGTFTWALDRYDAAAFIVAAIFAVTALVRLRVTRSSLVERWHDGRAGAESMKTLSWRYAVGGAPFGADEEDCAEAFGRRMSDVLSGLPGLGLAGDASDLRPTEAMELLREEPLETRRDAYLSERVRDQQHWYARKARWNRRRARFWGATILVLHLVAAGGAVLKGLGLLQIDAFGIAAAIIGSVAAWVATKQHSALSASYSVAARELEAVSAQWPGGAEYAWAAFVADAEEAISREHTMWLASARSRKPVDIT